MNYYAGYRLARFIIAVAVCIAVTVFTGYILMPLADQYWYQSKIYPADSQEYWELVGKAVALVLVPFLVSAGYALRELFKFLDSLGRRR